MPDRAAQIDAFLAEAGWQGADRQRLAGDLSPRRYSRLCGTKGSAILMDADTTMTPFVQITEWLRSGGLSAPDIIAGEPSEGLLLLEDLGDVSINRHLTDQPDQNDAIHRGCIDLLLAIRNTPHPALPCPDATELVEWTWLTDQHYPGVNSAGLKAFRAVLHDLLNDSLNEETAVSLRDFHADNLMWLPHREGIQRFGLLDYQDTILTHPAYDLMSFLTDARFDVTPKRREATLSAYLDRSDDAENAFRQAFAALAAQRNLRILGIFAKGAADGKAQHLAKLPRVHGYFTEALAHPAFDTVRYETLAALPDPEYAIAALSS